MVVYAYNNGHKMGQMFPIIRRNIPPVSVMDIGKLDYDGLVTSDTCNLKLKTRTLLVKQTTNDVTTLSDNTDNYDIMKDDCCNHIHNVWLGNDESDVNFFNEKIQNKLETIQYQIATHVTYYATNEKTMGIA